MERTISSCQLFVFFCFFLWTPFSYGDIVKAEFPYKMCGNIYYWCSVCGCGPVAVALWGTAHLLIGFPAFVPGFFPVWIICLNYWGNDKTWLSYTPDPFACMPVSQNVLYKHLWCFKFDVSCNYQLFILSCWSFFFLQEVVQTQPNQNAMGPQYLCCWRARNADISASLRLG